MNRKMFFPTVILLAACATSLVVSRIIVSKASIGRTFTDVTLIPHRHVGLVLGCPKQLSAGRPNLFFRNRISAASDLYRHGKVDYLIVSGDNHVHSYDEPTDMKIALIESGVPENRIYLDYAGFRTLDSVVRAKEIFGQQTITVVSQHFHNQRAIFLATHRGIDAIGFDAPEVDYRYSFKTRCREQFAKVRAVLDIYLFRKQPHFLGQKIAIATS